MTIYFQGLDKRAKLFAFFCCMIRCRGSVTQQALAVASSLGVNDFAGLLDFSFVMHASNTGGVKLDIFFTEKRAEETKMKRIPDYVEVCHLQGTLESMSLRLL